MEQQQCQNKKMKCEVEDTGLLEGPAEPPIKSIEDFMVLLCQQALTGAINYSACVSTQGVAVDVEKVITGHVWEATGFRFTYG
jgi:hypothetical protein